MKRHFVPQMKTARVEISAIGAGGDGLAILDGKPVYIAKTAPGDVVEALITGDHGRVQSVITASKERVNAPCPHFSRCGGCALQHVDEEFYRGWKIKKVQDALARENVRYETWNDPVFLPAATRRRVSMAAIKAGGHVTLGYNEPRSHTLLNILECLILEPLLASKIQMLRVFLPRILPDKKQCDVTLQLIDGLLDVVFTGPLHTKGRFSLEQDEAFGEMMEALDIARLSWRPRDFAPAEIILARRPILKKFGSLTVALPPATFLQASSAGEEALVKIVLENIKGAVHIADLFSGSGTFAGHILATGATVTAIDGDPHAMEALSATKHPRLLVQRRDLFKNPLGEKDLDTFDAVVFDPPRAGALALARRLAYANTRKIIGISCNPASFARDAAALIEGGFRLKSVTLVDQFVWSAHAEIAGIFSRS
jgi:23S rRNA (uracil1939-C5)-methyltransferase